MMGTKLWRVLTVGAAALVLAGCGGMMRLAYNNADIAARMAIDDYFALDSEQADLLRPRLSRFHSWHREVELPQYAQLAADAGARIQRGVAPNDVNWAVTEIRSRYRAIAARAIDDAAPVLANLNESNIVALEKKLAEGNAKLAREQINIDPARRQADQLKTLRKRVEDWIGDLTPEQQTILAAYIKNTPAYSKERFDDRLRRQREFVAALREHSDAADLARRLKVLTVQFDERRSPEYSERMRLWDQALVKLMTDLDRSLSPAQRSRATERFARYAEDFRVLAGRGGAPRQAALPARQGGG